MNQTVRMLAFALVAVALMGTPAEAQNSHGCGTIAQAKTNNPTFTHVEIQEPDKTRFLANYNAVEPVSTYAPEQVWVAFVKGESEVTVLFYTAGCYTYGDVIPVADFLRLMSTEPVKPGNPA